MDFNITTFTYSIPGMDIGPGPFLFTYVSDFLSFITPEDLPLELVRDALYSNLTLIELTTNAIKIESGFIALMSIFAVIAFIPFGAAVAYCCGRNTTAEGLSNRVDPLMALDQSEENRLICRKRASIVTMFFFFIILALSDFCIFYANSRLATTIEMTPEMVKSTVHDMGIFLKDTHLQIKHKLDNGFHAGIEKVIKDLEDVDVLLGEPIRVEISASTGIELAYDSLHGISIANTELINRVLLLQETVARALKISQEASARMEELQIQLSVLQRQCTFRDRPLCDTLRIRSFEENGIIDALKTLQEDQTIFRMRYLGEMEFGSTVKNLSSEVAVSKSIFGNFPAQVKHDTVFQRNDTLEQLERIKDKTTANAHMLTTTIVAMLDRLSGTWESFRPQYEIVQDYSNKYWTIGWFTALIIIWVLIFMLMGFCCLLCNAHGKAGVLMILCVIIISIGSFGIMIFGIATLAIGGNGEVFLCRPLFEGKEYKMLGKLFDKPGFVYAKEPQTGIIGELLRPAGENRSIVNVTLANALRGCEHNQASYNVFQLDEFVNTTQMVDLRQFPKVNAAISSIRVSERTLLSLTQTIQSILENMLHTSDFNLTSYRSSVSAPTPEKDLATFIDQMQRVALQIQDVATSSRMTTLGSRSKRLQASILQPLEQLQNEILYHLTALELQRDPWAKQVNQTLNHLRNIQGYLEKTASEICSNQTTIYTKRLKGYLTSNKATMSSQLGDSTAQCRPLFDIFDANRNFLCRNAVDYLNALWFCTFICLLLWSIGVPIGLNMISLQRKLKEFTRVRGTSSHLATRPATTPSTLQRSATLETLRSEDNNWGTSRSRARRTPPSGAPPPPPTSHAPPPQQGMTRHDSVRSVRWEAQEEMVFEDVDSPNPMYMMRDNLI